MSSFTTLQLVNRLGRKMRWGGNLTSLTSTDERQNASIDALNEAKEYVLDGKTWDFDARHDGVLVTQAVVDHTSTAVTNLATGFTAGTFAIGDYVARLLVTSDSSQGDTAYRILTSSGGVGVLDAAWLGSTAAANATSKTYFAEYKLPSTVKDVTSVRYQEMDVDLQFIGRDESFHVAFPRIHSEISDNPRTVVVGSQVTPTYETAGTASTPGLGMLVWPVPESAYRLEYSYTVKHPALTSSQGLQNVPDEIASQIVNHATSILLASNFGNDPDLATLNSNMAERATRRLWGQSQSDPNRRSVLPSLDQRGSRTGGGPANPRNFGSM